MMQTMNYLPNLNVDFIPDLDMDDYVYVSKGSLLQNDIDYERPHVTYRKISKKKNWWQKLIKKLSCISKVSTYCNYLRENKIR